MSHDFGTVDRERTVTHKFRFTNVGDAPLTLRPGGTTCSKCTIASIPKPELQPRESTDITIDYTPNNARYFQQTAKVITNDPDLPRVELNISGMITARYLLQPAALTLSKLSSDSATKAEVKLYSFLADDVRVVGHQFGEPELRAIF